MNNVFTERSAEIERCLGLSDEEQKFECLYPIVASLVRFPGRVLDSHTKEDLLQEVMLDIRAVIRDGRVPQSAQLSFFKRIAINNGFEFFRKFKSNWRNSSLDTIQLILSDPGKTPEEALQAQDREKLVEGLLEHLNERDRFVIREWMTGTPSAKIAEMLLEQTDRIRIREWRGRAKDKVIAVILRELTAGSDEVREIVGMVLSEDVMIAVRELGKRAKDKVLAEALPELMGRAEGGKVTGMLLNKKVSEDVMIATREWRERATDQEIAQMLRALMAGTDDKEIAEMLDTAKGIARLMKKAEDNVNHITSRAIEKMRKSLGVLR